MLRESSISTPRKFCCGTAALSTSVGRNRQKRRTTNAARRRPIRATRSRRRAAADGPREAERGRQRVRRGWRGGGPGAGKRGGKGLGGGPPHDQQDGARQSPAEVALLEH